MLFDLTTCIMSILYVCQVQCNIIYSRNFTRNLKNDGWKTTLLSGWYIFGGYVKLPGGRFVIQLDSLLYLKKV